ncbi:hypothetical protein I5677_13085 [Mobilitalea sibirica]|uniref:ABC transporter permease n=1 Tax=Mobilitalea sibirica TaxID=1462919 RepID=A0A8J7HC76_9FIRM|nr:hypothetical protein [Mobilitalea sibirica]MBH1941831.1 hypothetical protein [Mobilitalea sibirica]
MKKYLSLLRYEAKTILRDTINLYMCMFPIIILLLASYVFPMIFETMEEGQGLEVTMLILLIVVLIFGSFFLAAMATFLLLDNKDENTLNTVAVTPVGASGYIKFKMTYIYIMTVISTIVVLLGTKLIAGNRYAIQGVSLFDRIGIVHIIGFALVGALFTPALALVQSAFAKNKIEGFAFIKGTGMVAMIPILMILDTFEGGLQYILGIFPNFWAVKGLLLKLFPIENSANLNYPLYLLIGAAYNIFILIVAYRFFLKKVQY